LAALYAEDPAAALGGYRGHAGDRAALALAHVRHQSLAEVEHAAQVDVEHRIPVLRGDVHELQRLGDAGVVDQDVDMAERLDGAVGRLLAAVAVGHVAREAAVLSAEALGRVVRRAFVEVDDRDAGAVLGKQPRRSEADPARARGTGNDRHLAGEQHRSLQSVPAWEVSVDQMRRSMPYFTGFDESGSSWA
jgi:hypothetical protein